MHQMKNRIQQVVFCKSAFIFVPSAHLGNATNFAITISCAGLLLLPIGAKVGFRILTIFLESSFYQSAKLMLSHSFVFTNKT